MISFGQPLALLLLIPLLGWTLLRTRRLEALGRARRRTVTAMRCLLFTLIVLALAEIRLTRTHENLSVLFALDWSDSVPEEQRDLALQFIREALDAMGTDDQAGLMIFGRDPSIEVSPQALPELPKAVADVESAIAGARTNIAGALRLALAVQPETTGRRIVLLSDGNQNFGEAIEAARLAVGGGVPIDVFPLRLVGEGDVRISRVDVPNSVHLEAPFDVRVFVDSDRDTEATLWLLEDGRPIREDRVTLRGDIRNVFFIPRRIDQPGFHTYSARIEMPGDANPNNNTGQAFTSARGEPRVLLVDSEANTLGRDLIMALRAEEIEVDACAPESFPLSLAELQTYDSVIFSDVGASNFSRSQMEMIERGVQDLGLGFIMIGGPHSFGPGGYQDTPIERLLPVRMDVSHRRVLPNGALTVILHTCEFPSGNAWAREIAKAALDVLSTRDYFGVLYFGPPIGADTGQYSQYGYNWLDELRLVGDKSEWRRLIDAVSPGDMPDFDQTLQMAYDGLTSIEAASKHIVIISDGDPQPPNQNLARQIYDAGISISTVVMNPHHPQNAALLQQIARDFGGRFYYPTSPHELPRIFVREATVVRRSMIDENLFAPTIVRRSEAMPGFAIGETLRPLDGHVVTEPEPGADVPIVVPESDDPVLAHWRYGLGHTVAFTSDAKPRWASRWLTWGEYARFWAQLVRWSLRNSADRNFRVTTQLTGAEGLITIDAVSDDDQFINFAQFQGRLIPPSYDPDDVREITFRQTAPGRYEGRFEVDDIGSYMVSIATESTEGQTQLLTTGLSLSYSPEFQTSDTNVALLTELADMTEGRMNVTPREVFDHNLPASRSSRPMWPLSLALAAMVLPIDIFFRRVMIDWGDVRAGVATAWAWTVAVLIPRRRPVERDERTAALLDVKERVAEEREAGATAEDRERLQEALGRVRAQRDIISEVEKAPIRPKTPRRATGGDEAKPQAPAAKPEGYTGKLLEAKKRARKKMK
ncbi:VWA domain-containing protein [Candidatus Sumerlaeota bacterium]|nr:VWA domain-containing protein [Candidatus Sumerlaeota bacterium]